MTRLATGTEESLLETVDKHLDVPLRFATLVPERSKLPENSYVYV